MLITSTGCQSHKENEETESEENDEYDGPDKAILFEIERTKSPVTGRVPALRLWEAIQQTEQAKNVLRNSQNSIAALSWTERGPNGDFYGPQGNSRPNADQTAGRIRAAMIDSTDPSHKTVWVGGVDGGLWKTTDITAAPSNWTLINDYLSNLAISAICQDPRPGFQNIMYFCTGESFSNADAVRGVGVFKSTDGGVSWSFLSSTSTYLNGTRILCDNLGNVYLGTRTSGLLRSTDGGTSWTNITPSGIGNDICDLEISTTAAAGRLHVATGIFSTSGYRYTDNPSTVTSSTWTSPATGFTTFSQRTELGISGNVLYACPANGSYQVPTIWKSTDGGTNWTATSGQPTSGWASGQGWYSLSCGINPADANQCIVGGLDTYKTTDGGNSWFKISTWVGTSGQYVHADQHNLQWWDGGTKLMFTCDGGVHFSSDGGTTIRDRNKGLRLKQFYSVAIHPAETNYFIAGAQDNGVHRLNHVGLDSSIEVYGGDGCYVAIDQNEPQYQFGSYVYNVYRRSTNNGVSWSTPVNNQSSGRFVNPWDYDNNQNIVYACNTTGSYLRWNNPQTGGTTEVVTASGFTGNVSAVHASPYTPNKVYFGMGSGGIQYVNNANTGTSVTATNITPSGASGYCNSVVTGSSDQFLLATYSSYDVTHVWYSTNNGTSWTAIDGNLPNMPVRWALFHPDSDTKAYIATETGVWETDNINGASTVWTPSPSFPTVRTDMIKYRASDRTIAAGTHGRGIWTATVPLPTGFSFTTPSPATANCPAPATMSVNLGTTAAGGFSNPITLSAIAGVPSGTSVSFSTNPVTPGNSTNVILNSTNTLAPGTYTITIQGTATGATPQTVNVVYTINPGSGPSITAQPSNQTVCAGSNATFSITSATATSFQWQVSTDGGTTWTAIGGATTNSYTVTGATSGQNGNQYRCIATNLCGSTTSNAATLTVNTGAVITAQPSDATICSGQNNQLCVTATGTGLSYQWQSAATCGGTFTNITGATSNCYTASPGTTTAYRCQVNSSTCPGVVNSNCATITVVTSVTITGQPANQTVCEGSAASFTAAASGTGLSYQWQVSTDGGTTWNDISGAATATYNIASTTFAMNNNRYRCVISNGVCATPGITNAAILTVNTLPAISAHPQSATLCTGSNNTFSVTASGTGITYQWQISTDGGTTWTNIGGATTSSYTVTSVTAGMNNNRYRCVVSGTCTPPATSGAAVLTVISPVTVTTQPANVEQCSGGNATFSVAGSSSQTISYQWQVSVDGGTTWTNISGANASSYTINNTTTAISNTRYRCLLSNTTCTTPVASNNALLTVRALPTVGLSAAPLTSLLPGKTTTLTATPSASTGGTLTVSWLYNTNPLAVSGNIYVVNVEKVGTYQVRIQESFSSGLVCSNQSPVVTIDAPASDKVFIFPSPNNGRYTVSYYNSGGSTKDRQIVVFDSKGAKVYSKKFTITGAYTLLNIDMLNATGGTYYVLIGDASGAKLADGKVEIQH
ncbi:MAG: hypothetical protein U0U70_16085 [Chitinophagaceae bacterium]